MENIKTWRERVAERGIGSCEARDEEITELRAKLVALEGQTAIGEAKPYTGQSSAHTYDVFRCDDVPPGTKLYAAAGAAPVPVGYRLVPENMVIDSKSLRFLHGLSQPDDEGNYSEIRLLVGSGHAGHGLYASLDEYPEEGAEIICSFAITPSANNLPCKTNFHPDSGAHESAVSIA